MVDRLATFATYNNAVSNLMQRADTLSTSQDQLTSGKSVSVASDNPAEAAINERALSLQNATTANENAVNASTNAMTLTESSLSDAESLLQQARSLVVSAGDGTYSTSQLQAISQQVSAIRTQLLGVANTSNGQGGYLFGGQGSEGPPFLDAPGGVQYTGTRGQTVAASSQQLPLSMDGSSVFLSAPSGNGVFQTSNVNSSNAWIDAGSVSDPSALTGDAYSIQFSVANGQTTYSITNTTTNQPTSQVNEPFTSGQTISVDGESFSISGTPANGDTFTTAPSQNDLSAFDTLGQLATALNSTSLTQTQVTQAVQSGLNNIDQCLSQVSNAESFTGTTLNRLSGVLSDDQTTVVQAQTTESNATDLNMIQGLSTYNNEETAYSAALQSYASIQKLSLFNYISGS